MNKEFPNLFASDNCSGVHPLILEAISKVNHGHVISYGDDPITEQLNKKFQELFGKDAIFYPVYSGTGANVSALQACLRSFEAVVCTDVAHIHVDECGAPEKFIQSKVLLVPERVGKLKIDDVKPLLHAKGFEHHVQPKVISITQSTEYGTVYSIDEIRTICDFAHQNEMFVHMDGARIANAAASLSAPLKSFTTDCGIDILSFGGTKKGMMIGEGVLVLNPDLGSNFKYIRKQSMQLSSKMRFLSAQFLAYFENDLYLKLARNANAMAKYLAEKLESINDIKITKKVEVNAVFAIIPNEIALKMLKKGFFYKWNESIHEYRLMCSWDTTKDDIDNLLSDL
jgi:threonine aldolase